MLRFFILSHLLLCDSQSFTLQCNCANAKPECISICKEQERSNKMLDQNANNQTESANIDTVIFTKLIKPVLTIVKKYKETQPEQSLYNDKYDNLQNDIVHDIESINRSAVLPYVVEKNNGFTNSAIQKNTCNTEKQNTKPPTMLISHADNIENISNMFTSSNLTSLQDVSNVPSTNNIHNNSVVNIKTVYTTHPPLSKISMLYNVSTNEFGNALSQNFTTLHNTSTTSIFDNILLNAPYMVNYKIGTNSLENDFSSLASKESEKSFYNQFKTKDIVRLGEALPQIMSKKILQSQSALTNVENVDKNLNIIDSTKASVSNSIKNKKVTKTITKTKNNTKPIQPYNSNLECYAGISFSKTYLTTVVTPYITIMTTEFPSISFLSLTTLITKSGDLITKYVTEKMLKNDIYNYSDHLTLNFNDDDYITKTQKHDIRKLKNGLNALHDNIKYTTITIFSTYTPYITRSYTEYPLTSYKTVTESYTETPLETIIKIIQPNKEIKTAIITQTLTTTVYTERAQFDNKSTIENDSNGINDVVYNLQTRNDEVESANTHNNLQQKDTKPDFEQTSQKNIDNLDTKISKKDIENDPGKVTIYKTVSRTKDICDNIENDKKTVENDRHETNKKEPVNTYTDLTTIHDNSISSSASTNENSISISIKTTTYSMSTDKQKILEMSKGIKNHILASISTEQKKSDENSMSKLSYESMVSSSINKSMSDIFASVYSNSIKKLESDYKSKITKQKKNIQSTKDEHITNLSNQIAKLKTAQKDNLSDIKVQLSTIIKNSQNIDDFMAEIEDYVSKKILNDIKESKKQSSKEDKLDNDNTTTPLLTTITITETVTNTNKTKSDNLQRNEIETAIEDNITNSENSNLPNVTQTTTDSHMSTVKSMKTISTDLADNEDAKSKTIDVKTVNSSENLPTIDDNIEQTTDQNMSVKNFSIKDDNNSTKTNQIDSIESKDIETDKSDNTTKTDAQNTMLFDYISENMYKSESVTITPSVSIENETKKSQDSNQSNTEKDMITNDVNTSTCISSHEITTDTITSTQTINESNKQSLDIISSAIPHNTSTTIIENITDDDTKTNEYSEESKTSQKIENKLRHESTKKQNSQDTEYNDKSFFEKLIDKGYDLFHDSVTTKKPEKTTTYINLAFDTDKLYVFNTDIHKHSTNSLDAIATKQKKYSDTNDQIDKLSSKITDFYDLLNEKMESIETMNEKVYLSSQISLIADMLYSKLTQNNEKIVKSIAKSSNFSNITSAVPTSINIPKEDNRNQTFASSNHTKQSNKSSCTTSSTTNVKSDAPFLEKIINKLGFGEQTEQQKSKTKRTTQTIHTTKNIKSKNYAKKQPRKTVTHTIYEYQNRKVKENQKPD
ncbi:hypothetical protein BDAP_000919 [Binucleata daphniae]